MSCMKITNKSVLEASLTTSSVRLKPTLASKARRFRLEALPRPTLKRHLSRTRVRLMRGRTLPIRCCTRETLPRLKKWMGMGHLHHTKRSLATSRYARPINLWKRRQTLKNSSQRSIARTKNAKEPSLSSFQRRKYQGWLAIKAELLSLYKVRG